MGRGIVTDRDLVVRALSDDIGSAIDHARRGGSDDLDTVSPDDDLEAAGKILREHAVPLLLRVPAESDLSESVTALGALAATLIIYGLVEYAGGYGFVGTFVGAATIRGSHRGHRRHRQLQGVAEIFERVLMVTIVGLFGGAIAGGLFATLQWRHVAVALLVILVVRPIAAGVALIGLQRAPWRDRAAISFFGTRGIATFYYLAYAMEQAQFPGQEQLWATAGLIVLLSIIIHGLTAAPVLQRLDARRQAEP